MRVPPSRVRVAGSALASVSGQGGFDVRSSFVNRGTIPEATLDWTLEEGVGEWRLSGLVGSGSFSGTGGIDLRDGTVVRVASGVLRDLDVAAILGDSTGSGLNGTLVGIGKVASGEPVGFAGRLELGRSWYGVFEADSAAVGIDLRDERLEADVRVRLLGGSAELTVEAALDDAWSAKVTRGRFRGLDLGALRPSEPFSTELGGSWTGEVAPQGDGLAGRLAVNFGPSRINRLVVDTASVEATLREGALTYLGMVSYPAGEFHVEGEGRPLDSLPVWRISASRFADLDVAALLDLSGPAVRLSGDLETWVQGADRPGLAGEVALVLGPSQIGGWALRSATLGGRIGEGRFEGMAEAEVEGAEAVLDGTLDFGSSVLRYGGRGSFSVTDLERASQLEGMTGALAGTFDFDGYGVGVDSVRASGAVRLAAGTIRGMSVDSAKAVGRAESGRAVFDTLAVWSPDLAVRGEGALALLPDAQVASDLKILATVRGPEPLRALLGLPEVGLAEGVIEVSVTGPADGLEIYGKAAGTGLSYSTARFARFEATAEASLDDRRRLVHLDSRASADSLRWGNLSTEGVRLSVASEGEGYDVSVDAVVDADRRARLVAAVGVDGAGTDVRFMEISFEAGEESWALDRIAHVRIEDGVRVTDFRLSSASGRVVVDGSLNPMGELSLEAAAEGVRFGAFAELMGYGAYSGALDASVAVTGSASSPIVAGDLSGEVAFRGAPPQRLTAEILYEDLHLNAQGSIRNAVGREVRFGARLPMSLTLQPADSIDRRWAFLDSEPLSFDLSSDEFQLDWVAPFLDAEAFREPRSTLDADIRVRGTMLQPVLDGSVFLRDGSVYAPLLGLRLEDALVNARLEGQRIIIDRGEVRSGGGTLEVTGEIEARSLTMANLDLDLVLDGFEALHSEFIRATVDGKLTLGGTTEEPRVAGSLDVLRGDVFLGGDLVSGDAEIVELTEADYAMLEERFGYRPSSRDPRAATWRESVGLAVDLRFGGDTWIRQRASPRLTIQLGGDIRVTKEPGEIESIVGTLEAVPRRSHIEQFGRRFDLVRGDIVFNGAPLEARIDLETEYAVPSKQNPDAPEIVIKLGVEGGMDDLRLILSSDPVVENADIVSYLATGRPASQTLQTSSLGGGALVGRGTSLALDRATGVVEGFASENVGLDIVEIRTDAGNGATLIAGRYVAPRLYLGFKQPVSRRRSEQSVTGRSRAPEIEVEYQTFRWLLLNLQRGGSRIEFFLRSRYAY